MNLSKLGGMLCLLGGVAWAVKYVYDWQVLGRLEHQGYIPYDVTDYLYFIVPLFCLAGLMTLYTSFKTVFKRIEKVGLFIAGLGLLLVANFHFWNAYFFESGVPSGLLFLAPGMVFSFVGLLMFVAGASRLKVIPKWVFWIPMLLCALMIIWPVASATIYHYYDNAVSTRWGVLIQVLTGMTWVALGYRLFVDKQTNIEMEVGA